jgi:hypothetical protein
LGIGTFQTMGLIRCQVKPGRIAQRIDAGMDFVLSPSQLRPSVSAWAPPFSRRR